MANFSYEVYKFDKDCLKFFIFVDFVMLFLFLIGFFVCYINEQFFEVLFFIILCPLYSYFILFTRIKFLNSINNQKFFKITIDGNDNVSLIDRNNTAFNFNTNDIAKNEIIKFGISALFSFLRTYSCSFLKFGQIKFITKSGEVHNIIISDIDDFLSKTVYQNVVDTKLL